MIDNEISENVEQLKSQISVMEQLLEVYEQSVMEQSVKLQRTKDELEHSNADLHKLNHAAYHELQESEKRFRDIAENSMEWIWEVDHEGKYTYSSPVVERILGYKPGEVLGKYFYDYFHPEDREDLMKATLKVFSSKQAFRNVTNRNIHKNGSIVWLKKSGIPIVNEVGTLTGYRGADTDITEQRNVEEKIGKAKESYESLVRNIPDALYSSLPDETGTTIYVSPRWKDWTGYSPEDFYNNSETWPNSIHLEDRDRAVQSYIDAFSNRKEYIFEYRLVNKDNGEVHHVRDHGIPLKDETGKIIRIDGIVTDITDRKRAEDQVQRQVSRLDALHSIDKAIASSFDINITSDILLNQVTAQLGVDAATILRLNPHTYLLEYIGGKGFRTRALKYTRLKMGESNAGRAAIERRIVMINNLKDYTDGFLRSDSFPDEEFVSYIGVPLIAKGLVKGVLELFHRTPLHEEPEWMDFIETIADQAAIVMDNATLFEDLQRSNTDLVLAYDSTIEGWSKALDMRDKETEGHSQRVMEMTLRIAYELGIREEEHVHIRRGALLHDIGKLGVPDNILLKPDPLTDEEWVIMKRHPRNAYDVLKKIIYLKPALDIPYCHHEKWDGTGYPRGLNGEEIPLAARIFAIVDVWDALRSDRPYRPAWPKEKVIEHVRSLSGTHFDPEIVEIFLKMEL